MLLFVAVIGVTALLFFQPQLGRYPLAFLCMPLLVWPAFRFRAREVVTAAACMSTIATWATVTHHGPFVMATPNESLLVLQAFTALFTLTALMMSALVQERRALLERERAALAEAETALRSSDTFLAMLSHELRNPLSAIAAAGAVLEQPGMAPNWNARAGQIIRRQTALLKRLIDDLLDVAKITGGKLTLERRPLDLARPRRDHRSLARGFRPSQASVARPSAGQRVGRRRSRAPPASDHQLDRQRDQVHAVRAGQSSDVCGRP